MRSYPPRFLRPGTLGRLLLPLLATAFGLDASAGQTTTPVSALASGAFANTYAFTIGGSPATVEGDTDSTGITWLGVLLENAMAAYTALDPNPDDGFIFTGLPTGNYKLTFLGSGPGEFAGHLTVNTPDVAQVPEPSSLGLLLTSLGMLGWATRRRRGREVKAKLPPSRAL